MQWKHKADMNLPKWLEDAAEETVMKTKKASADPYVPFGAPVERGTQLYGDGITNLVQDLSADEMQTDESKGLDEKMQEAKTPEEKKKVEELMKQKGIEPIEESQDDEKPDTEEMKKKIDEAKTPEDLAKLEQELSKGAPAKAEPAKEETAPAEAPASAETTAPTESVPDVGELKKELEDMKKKIEETETTEKLQNQIDELKKRLENFEVQDNADMNDSIDTEYQASLKHAQRTIRRIRTAIKELG